MAKIGAEREDWDKEYQEGRWQRLRKVKEVGHYAVIAGYFRYFKGEGRVLDVGCGEGILQEYLKSYGYSRYLGIDISQIAIDNASAKQDETTTFRQSDETFTTNDRYDVIIFNEVLYFLEDPLKVLRRFESFLTEHGVLIVSMYGHDRRSTILRDMRRAFSPVIQTTVTTNRKTNWRVDVLAPTKVSA